MATRKGNTKGGTAKSARSSASNIGTHPPYGLAIRDALTRGDASEMKRVAASARKYLRDVGAAADKLDKALGKGKG